MLSFLFKDSILIYLYEHILQLEDDSFTQTNLFVNISNYFIKLLSNGNSKSGRQQCQPRNEKLKM